MFRSLAILFILLVGNSLQPAYGWRLESGRTTLNDTFSIAEARSVTFQTPFDEIPVVIALPTNQGGDPSDLRISGVTRFGFDVLQVEPTGNDGAHVAMTIDYVAAEPGSHRLPDNTLVIVGRTTTSTYQGGSNVPGPQGWDTITFPMAFPSAPTLLADIQTMESEDNSPPGDPSAPFLSIAVQNVSATTFQLALERSEVDGGALSPETIGYIAIEANETGTFTDSANQLTSWSSTTSGRVVSGWDDGCTTLTYTATAWPSAHAVATKTSHFGGDGGWVRRCGFSSTTIGLTVDEDLNNDTERNHTTEIVSILAFERSFHANFGVELNVSKSVEVVEDPINGILQPFMISGSRARYTISFSSAGNLSPDSDSLRFVDTIPDNMALRVVDFGLPGSGPVDFMDGSPSSGLSLNFSSLSSTTDDIAFSSNGGLTFDYTPVIGGDGTDPAVTDIEITPSGTFAPIGTGGSPNFTLQLDMIVQ